MTLPLVFILLHPYAQRESARVKYGRLCATINSPDISVFLQPGNGPAQWKGVNPARSGRKQR